ncbi:MAG: QacE family quaternary ammonium compound efflux SMR transporter [Brevundimonas sp.]|nr:MAG: QacE family quaternary ammonium compound efflux SMR transporter [Brevundimonas sp.]
MHSYFLLAGAVVCEVVATCFVKSSDGLTRPLPSLIIIAGSIVSFYLLALALKTIPTGMAYAIWCGMGIVLITLTAWLVFGQKVDAAALGGIGLILTGVMVIQLFSKTATV